LGLKKLQRKLVSHSQRVLRIFFCPGSGAMNQAENSRSGGFQRIAAGWKWDNSFCCKWITRTRPNPLHKTLQRLIFPRR
jgi:hypothetical protein